MKDSDDRKQSIANFRDFGEGAEIDVVRAGAEDAREWLIDSPVCGTLSQYNILHVAFMKAGEGLAVSRAEQSGTFMLACTKGVGMVLADGRWKRIKEGEACLLPPFVGNSFKAIDGQEWEFCWVRYIESKDTKPIISEMSPVSGAFDGQAMKSAIIGLHAESKGAQSVAANHLWTELIHQYVLSFAQPHQSDERLWKVWSVIEKHLDQDWSLTGIAQLACVSEEHLRRLCNKQLGRSPMQHLTFLRMQQASKLLSTTDEKVESIAKAVGYSSAFHFSNVFTKWVGCRPSEHRR
jgi:AraC-like DNA-binding protein